MKTKVFMLLGCLAMYSNANALPKTSEGWVLKTPTTVEITNNEGATLMLSCSKDGAFLDASVNGNTAYDFIIRDVNESHIGQDGETWDIEYIPIAIGRVDSFEFGKYAFDAKGLVAYKPIFDVCSTE